MQPKSDAQLLGEYAEDGAESAFAEIVARHTNLVYSAALRQVDSPDIAVEVAQCVFIGLARSARPLSRKLAETASLAGWLCRSARNISLNFRRDEFRRHSRERQAMENLDSTPDTAPDWERLRSVLDEAMFELSESDYEALVLRFFKNQDLRSVGLALCVSDDAAQKRVSRALERLRDLLSRRGITTPAAALSMVLSANAVQAAPAGLALTISTAAVLACGGVQTSTTIAATKAIAMTTLQKAIIGATVATAVGTGIYESGQTRHLRGQVQTLQEQQVPLTEHVRHLQRERDDAKTKVAALQQENERLRRDTAELAKLRGEVARSRDELRSVSQGKTKDANDPAAVAAQAWLDRVKLLEQRFEEWPGKKTPELQLLSGQDWLNEVANRELDSDAACSEAMSRLRFTAKGKFASAVNEALEEIAKSNKEQLPSELTQLMPYLKPPMDSFLEGYEIAKPGWVHPPKPSSPNSERAETWAIVEKGNFTPDGIPIRDGSNLADPDHDMYIVIYRGGFYGYGTGKPLN